MKFLTTFAFVFFMQTMNAQTPYTIVKDEKNPGGLIYTGMINKYTLINEASFTWYNDNQKNYKPSTELLNGFEASKSKVNFIIFGTSLLNNNHKKRANTNTFKIIIILKK